MFVGLQLTTETILALLAVGIGWAFLFVVIWALLWAHARTRRNTA